MWLQTHSGYVEHFHDPERELAGLAFPLGDEDGSYDRLPQGVATPPQFDYHAHYIDAINPDTGELQPRAGLYQFLPTSQNLLSNSLTTQEQLLVGPMSSQAAWAHYYLLKSINVSYSFYAKEYNYRADFKDAQGRYPSDVNFGPALDGHAESQWGDYNGYETTLPWHIICDVSDSFTFRGNVTGYHQNIWSPSDEPYVESHRRIWEHPYQREFYGSSPSYEGLVGDIYFQNPQDQDPPQPRTNLAHEIRTASLAFNFEIVRESCRNPSLPRTPTAGFYETRNRETFFANRLAQDYYLKINCGSHVAGDIGFHLAHPSWPTYPYLGPDQNPQKNIDPWPSVQTITIGTAVIFGTPFEIRTVVPIPVTTYVTEEGETKTIANQHRGWETYTANLVVEYGDWVTKSGSGFEWTDLRGNEPLANGQIWNDGSTH